jgi:hypothetical protein
MNKANTNIDQIDIEELLKEFKIMDLGSLKCYLKEVYRVH